MSEFKCKFVSVAIDGPSGAGKSSLAKNLAAKLGFLYLDTGALYRTIGLYAYESGVNGDESEKIKALILNSRPEIEAVYIDGVQKTFLNGRDVSEEIRRNFMSKYASDVSKIPEVREFLLDIQRKSAENNNIIMDGRDIGTVILPNADVKIFLTSSPEERARRRCEELNLKGQAADYAQILSEINERDRQDSGREAAPLKPADDAVILDNSDCESPDESLGRAVKIVKEMLPDAFV
ncbi:MAG: (d)CMP kinase [Oscillospiraceae bacterium]|nr:(d)CMP kinase [Oscillospiraceae bacterium]